MERRLTAILAADVVGYSRLMGTDEAGTLARLKSLRGEFIDFKITEHQGRIVKLTGDGILAEFPSVVSAVACAAEMQRGLRERAAEVPVDRRIEFRIGINLGDVIVEQDDIYGDGVNVAVRLGSLAAPGGIVVSQSVRDHVGNRLDVTFEDGGEQTLKNIEKPIRVYSVRLEDLDFAETASMRNSRPSIVVLPFSNMSGDPEQEYFSDGITEDIITDLSKISGLFVVARHTAFTYKSKLVKVEQVGRELGVAFVLEGSVRKAGARVRVTAQLTGATTGGHVWAERFDRDLTDIFAIQDEITHAIVEQLKVKLLPQEKKLIGESPTLNVEAYTYYLRGRDFLYARPAFQQGKIARAAELLERASEINSADYKPPALLIQMYRSLGRDSDAKAAARTTVELGERELVLHPEDPRPAVAGALALLELGEKDRARDWTTRAQAIESEDPISLYNIACVYSHLGDSDAAFDLLERVTQNGRQFWRDWIENDSDLDGVRNHPRYAQLLTLLNERMSDFPTK